jgi:hypothetical protein
MSMAADTGPSQPTSRKLGVVILGASTYPHFPPSRHLDNESFARSAAAFRNLMSDEGVTILGNPAILDLFDVDDDFASILRRIKAFLKSEITLTDVVFYYCGHGDFLLNRTYYLTLKATEPEDEAFTSLPVWQLRQGLETQLMRKRVFLVFDCCFSGQAAKEWMSAGIGHVIEEQIFQSFPKRGTALIAASARSGPAKAPEGESLTMFTGALINTVSNGVAGEKSELSFRDVVDAVRARISDRYGSAGVAPEIHAPQQDEGDVSFVPFFINRAFVGAPETKAERETFELAIADLDRPLLRTREAAVETLAELLSSSKSAGFRREIMNKLKTVQQEDDSQRIKGRCKDVLARWLEPSGDRNGEGADGSGMPITGPEPPVLDQATRPGRPLAATRTLLGVFIGLVMFLGIFGYFYLRSMEKVEVSQTQSPLLSPQRFGTWPVPDRLPLPLSSEKLPSSMASAQPSLPASIVPNPPPQTVDDLSGVSQNQGPVVTPSPGPVTAFGCEGQTDKVIFEDNFTDDSGGWVFGKYIVLKAPGATTTLEAGDKAIGRVILNQTFTATTGDFCIEGSLPEVAAKTNPGIGVAFWGRDISNFWAAVAYADGRVMLFKCVSNVISIIFDVTTNNRLMAGNTDVNSVRVVVKKGTITVVVNGQKVKSVRAQAPTNELKFGIDVETTNPSATPITFTMRSYKVTAVD